MRIVIDLQGAQSTGSRNRGIGRYSISLSKAIIRNRGNHEIIIVLNGFFPDTIESIRADFYALLPQGSIRVWDALEPVNSLNADNDWRRESAELVREAFIANLKPDMLLVTSLFEGLDDDAVTSIGSLTQSIPTATILYDLIPYIHRSPYLDNPVVEVWYEAKLEHMRHSNILLSISESSRQEGLCHLGFPEKDIVNISTAADVQFQPQAIGSQQEIEIRNRYNLQRPYVMYTGGIDHRKNIEGLIRAYARLPKVLRAEHQLAIVCSIQQPSREALEALAKEQGLAADELILTGFVTEDDLPILYNLCKVFVFPSWHEGFGLPALEAMSCGRAVIGANTSSVPEVIGRDDALFDPNSDKAIAKKMEQVLIDDTFRLDLEHYGLEQAKKFTWDKSAIRAIAAFEQFHVERQQPITTVPLPAHRPKLAYVSPLPPERSGISDYSAELVPELAHYYNVDVIVVQDSVTAPWIKANCQIRDVKWFRAHSDHYDRVIYHFGNSSFHQHMFELLDEIPGIVVLHDVFLSGIVAHMDIHGFTPNGWAIELYHSHGYKAIQERFHAENTADIIWRYPCNIRVLRKALGVIVHSESSWSLARCWYALDEADHWPVIPLLRVPGDDCDQIKLRHCLGLNTDDFVICTFGMLASTKLNHRILDAWLASALANDKKCVLVFVGENEGGEYGREVLAMIQQSGLSKRIRITGWVDLETFRHYLTVANIAVQLRMNSRGETSAAVLDCMNYGLPTIVNAHGSMAELPDNAVWKLPDKFNNAQLTEAMETLWRNTSHREQLGKQAREIILNRHAPRACADQYFGVIENVYRSAETNIQSLIHAIAKVESEPDDSSGFRPMAEAIARSIPPRLSQRQLLVDVSELVQHDNKTDIQRVVRSILTALFGCPPGCMRVEPVYATTEHGYRYARHFSLNFLGCPTDILNDDPIEYRPGDIFLGLDLQPQVVIAHRDFYQQLRRHGVQVQFVVYDLLCVLMPQYFVGGALECHKQWLGVVVQSDGAICISRAVADELAVWVKEHDFQRLRPFSIDWFHLGADIENSMASCGMPEGGESVLTVLADRPSFLMVGTIEPRKGYAQVLASFEQLWADGVDVNLVIVGKAGWMVEPLLEKIRTHPELGERLFWLEGISDEYLEKIYAAATCLITASEGEGFGLPLIEAAQRGVPIIARDIPVFREVAGEHACFFKSTVPNKLAQVIRNWIELFDKNKVPLSENMLWQTWEESANQLIKIFSCKESHD